MNIASDRVSLNERDAIVICRTSPYIYCAREKNAFHFFADSPCEEDPQPDNAQL